MYGTYSGLQEKQDSALDADMLSFRSLSSSRRNFPGRRLGESPNQGLTDHQTAVFAVSAFCRSKSPFTMNIIFSDDMPVYQLFHAGPGGNLTITWLHVGRTPRRNPPRKPLSNPVWTGPPAWCYCTGFPAETRKQPLTSLLVPAPLADSARTPQRLSSTDSHDLKREEMARHTPQLACRSPKKHFVRSISQVCQCSFLPCKDVERPVTARSSRWLSGNGNSLAIFGCHGVFEFPWRELPSRPAYLHPAMGAESFLWFLGPVIDHKSMFLHSVE